MELIILLGGVQAAGSKISMKTFGGQSYLRVTEYLNSSFRDIRAIELLQEIAGLQIFSWDPSVRIAQK